MSVTPFSVFKFTPTYIMAAIVPVRAIRKETKAGTKDVYRVIVARQDIPRVYHTLKKIDAKLRSRKSKPLFDRMTPYHDVLVVHSNRSNFCSILTLNIGHMKPCILRAPSLPGRRRLGRMTADHPILGPN